MEWCGKRLFGQPCSLRKLKKGAGFSFIGVGSLPLVVISYFSNCLLLQFLGGVVYGDGGSGDDKMLAAVAP